MASAIQNSLGVSRCLTTSLKRSRSQYRVSTPTPDETKDEDSFDMDHQLLDVSSSKMSLPPEWVDYYDRIHEDMRKISNMQKKLDQVLGRRSTSPDSKRTEKQVSSLLCGITDLIRTTEYQVKDLSLHKGTYADEHIRKNIQQSMAKRLMNYTRRFRESQEHYMQNKAQNNSGSTEADSEISDFADFQQANAMVTTAHERKQEVDTLLANLTELGEIFKELSKLTVHQGSILDRIDMNVHETKIESEKAVENLVHAEEQQKCTGMTACLILLVALVLLFGIIFIYKEI